MGSEADGIAIVKEVAELLEAQGVDYWLGRGRFRHFTLTGEFGDTESDIDIHVLRTDEEALRNAVQMLVSRGYTIEDDVSRHKLATKKSGFGVEFVYLDQLADDLGSWFHETVFPLRKRFVCPAEALGTHCIDFFGSRVRVPEAEYLPCVFGPRWREDKKGSGGAQI